MINPVPSWKPSVVQNNFTYGEADFAGKTVSVSDVSADSDALETPNAYNYKTTISGGWVGR